MSGDKQYAIDLGRSCVVSLRQDPTPLLALQRLLELVPLVVSFEDIGTTPEEVEGFCRASAEYALQRAAHESNPFSYEGLVIIRNLIEQNPRLADLIPRLSILEPLERRAALTEARRSITAFELGHQGMTGDPEAIRWLKDAINKYDFSSQELHTAPGTLAKFERLVADMFKQTEVLEIKKGRN